jgi:hypothetical protein
MTTPPPADDPADTALPYGPPAAAGPAAEATPDAEKAPANPPAREVLPDKAPGRVGRQINALKKLSLLTLVGGAIGTFLAYLAEDLREIDLHTLVLISSICLVLVCALPLVLLVMGSRHRRRKATRRAAASAAAWGVIVLGLGLLAVVPTLVGAAGEIIEDAAIRSRPPTAAESEFTPAELRTQAESLLGDLAAAANAVPATVHPGMDPPELTSEPCVLSNLGPGVIVSSSDYRYYTPGESVSALDGVEAYWREAGYEPHRSGGDRTVDRIHPQVSVSSGPIDLMGVYAPNDITYNTLIIEYQSVCVAE